MNELVDGAFEPLGHLLFIYSVVFSERRVEAVEKNWNFHVISAYDAFTTRISIRIWSHLISFDSDWLACWVMFLYSSNKSEEPAETPPSGYASQHAYPVQPTIIQWK